MTAIWWTIYILAAFTIVIVWLNLITLFIRMEIASQLEKYEIFRNTYPGLMKDEFKLQKKEDK